MKLFAGILGRKKVIVFGDAQSANEYLQAHPGFEKKTVMVHVVMRKSKGTARK